MELNADTTTQKLKIILEAKIKMLDRRLNRPTVKTLYTEAYLEGERDAYEDIYYLLRMI